MQPRHFDSWPPGLPRTLPRSDATLHACLEETARRFPGKAATVFEGETLSWQGVQTRAEALAGHLQSACGVRQGDRVLLVMQNGPQWVISCWAILRADAVVVPLAPMNVPSELAKYLEDSEARVAIVESDIAERFAGISLEHLIVAGQTPIGRHALAPSAARPADLCMMPYTSGSTGKPKGCMHTHQTVLHNVIGAARWKHVTPETVALATAPFFHVTGLVHSFLATAWAGGTMVIQRRWDPQLAAELVERHRCTHWDNVPTMVVDLLSHPQALRRDVSSLKWIFGGGSAMPEAIAQKLFDVCGVRYIEGYGMTETISQTHINPPQNPKQQCLGIPTFDTESLVIDPESLAPLPPGEQGEIVVRGPQLLTGYWKKPEETRASWIEVEGKPFFRTGDLGSTDDEGYFYISDRLKRMINASGYKVWPAEVEAKLYKHPAIQECCIIGSPDERRGETVKAVVVLKPGASAGGDEILQWARGEMAPYKAPRKIEFRDRLPRTASGKIQWRELQEREFGG